MMLTFMLKTYYFGKREMYKKLIHIFTDILHSENRWRSRRLICSHPHVTNFAEKEV